MILNLLLFILPFIFIPTSSLNFEIPKVILAEVLIEFLFLILIIRNKFPKKVFQKKLIIPLVAIFVLSLNPSGSFFGNEFRLQGIFLLWNLILLAIIASVLKINFLNKKYLKYILIALFLIGLALGFTIDARMVSTIGEPNALASYVIFLFPFSLNFILSAIIIFLTGSRAAVIAFTIEIIALFLIKRKINIRKTVLTCFILILLSLIFPFLEKNRFENRSEIWQTAVSQGIKSPFIGNGVGNITLGPRIDSAHNIILDWWVQGGIIGLIAFLSLIYFTIVNFINKKQTTYLISFLGLITTLLFNPASIVNLIPLFWLIGVSFN